MDRALALFWRKGYQAASLADLLAEMRIGRSSFYAAFTDKRSLFILCLDLFAERTLAILERAGPQAEPLEMLQGFFERNFQGPPSARAGWGCMLVNTVLEMADVDEALAARAGQHLDRVQQVFEIRLLEAGASPDQALQLAQLLMVLNEGIRVSSRRRLPDGVHLQSISTAFHLIRSRLA